MSEPPSTIPVTVRPGVLGAGKTTLLCCFTALGALSAPAAFPHVHGEAALTLVADELEARLEVEISAEVVLGREAPPRNDDERAKEAAALRELERKAGALLVVPTDCAWRKVVATVERHGHHAEVELVGDLECREPLGGRTVVVEPAALHGLHMMRVSIIGPTGAQSAAPKKRWTSGPL